MSRLCDHNYDRAPKLSGDRQGSKDLVAAVQTCHAEPERAKPASIHQVKPCSHNGLLSGASRPAFGDCVLSQTLLSQSSSETGSEMVQ